MLYPLAYISYDDEEIDAVISTLRAGQTTCGKRVRAFEESFSSFVGSKHAVMVNSGSSADLLVAFGLGPPDRRTEILVPAVTWPTQVWSCLVAGYTVRLVDVDPNTLQMDIDDLKRKINTDTRAIFLVHLLGNVGNIDAIREVIQPFEGVDIIEDCCEALGSQWKNQHVGTFGKASAFSFFFSHMITTMEGGMVVTNQSPHQYQLLRSHGWEPQPNCRFSFPAWGFNIRPTEVQGAFGGIQMKKIQKFIQARSENVAQLATGTYEKYPDWLQGCTVLPDCKPAWHGFPLLVKENRDELIAHLERNGIETRPIVAGNIARQKAVIGEKRVISGELPGADYVHANGFYMGIPWFRAEEQINQVIKIFKKF